MPAHPERIRRNYEGMCPVCLKRKQEPFSSICRFCWQKSVKTTDKQRKQYWDAITDEEKKRWLEGSWDIADNIFITEEPKLDFKTWKFVPPHMTNIPPD